MEKIILNKTITYKFLISLFLILFFTDTLFAGNNFVKSQIRKGELNLYFSSDIERVTYFSLPESDGMTKYIYDIHGGVLPADKGISKHSFRAIESFRMGQNSPTKLRVIIRSKQKFSENHVYSAKCLTIPLIHNGKKTTNSKKVVKSSRKAYTVVIDAGHGGKDSGASCCTVKTEKKVVFSVASKLKKRLENKGYKVYMTRDDDSFVRLPKRTEFANKKKADIFLSIHANAAPKDKISSLKGIETFFLSPAKTEKAKRIAAKENKAASSMNTFSKNTFLSFLNRTKIIQSNKLAIDLQSGMLSKIRKKYKNVRDGGVREAPFWVLVGAQMPAAIIEIGYITNPMESDRLANPFYQSLSILGIC